MCSLSGWSGAGRIWNRHVGVSFRVGHAGFLFAARILLHPNTPISPTSASSLAPSLPYPLYCSGSSLSLRPLEEQMGAGGGSLRGFCQVSGDGEGVEAHSGSISTEVCYSSVALKLNVLRLWVKYLMQFFWKLPEICT